MEANDMKAMREALEFADKELRMATESDKYGDDLVYLIGCMRTVATACRSALSAPPRACDVMSQEDLTKVVISGFMKSLGIGQENQIVSQLVEAAISAAVKCAYDTQLVSKGEEGVKWHMRKNAQNDTE